MPWLPLQAEDVVNPDQGIGGSWPVPPFLSFRALEIQLTEPRSKLPAFSIPPNFRAEKGPNPNDTWETSGNLISFLV